MNKYSEKLNQHKEINLPQYLAKLSLDLNSKGLSPLSQVRIKPNNQIRKSSNTNHLLSCTNSITWLKKRHMKTAKTHYLKTKQEIKTD